MAMKQRERDRDREFQEDKAIKATSHVIGNKAFPLGIKMDENYSKDDHVCRFECDSAAFLLVKTHCLVANP